MKMTLTICLLLLTGMAISQNRPPDFSYVDRKVNGIEGKDPVLLSKQLTEDYTRDIEKVRSIFRWIADNISYYKKPPPSKRKQRKGIREYEPPAPSDTGALPPLTDRVAAKVLEDRQAVCEGYARLFKSLCDHAGIQSEIITGYARSEPSILQSRFRSNHSWNAVFIDSSWFLLDVTWASGVTISNSGEFLRYFDDYYFLTPPDKFIRHHYPDDLRWTLLDDCPVLTEFKSAPYKQRSYVKYPIVHYFPRGGIIEATVGDTIRLELATNPDDRLWSIGPDSLWDAIDFTNPSLAYVQPITPAESNKYFYSYPVVSENTQWLHVMLNNDVVLRYRLKIRKDLVKEARTSTD